MKETIEQNIKIQNKGITLITLVTTIVGLPATAMVFVFVFQYRDVVSKI